LANKFFIALVFFNKSFFILSTVPYSVTFDSIVALKLSSAIYSIRGPLLPLLSALTTVSRFVNPSLIA